MRKILILLLMVSIFMVGCGKNNSYETKDKVDDKVNIEQIEVSDVWKLVDNYKEDGEVRIIDVRTEDEYAEGHIKNATNIPLDEIEEINLSKDIDIIVYCRSGSRSYQAAMILSDLGYSVKDMGGLNNWNYELEK